MSIELKIPEVGESITEVEIGGWLKAKGEPVRKDEPVVTLESEKATVELPAPESGTLSQIVKQKGEVAKVGEVIGYLEKDGQAAAPTKAPEKKPAAKPAEPKPPEKPAAAKPEPKAETKAEPAPVMPAAQRALAERGLRPEQVAGTGPGGRVLKEDVARHAEERQEAVAADVSKAPGTAAGKEKTGVSAGREAEIVPMSRSRRTVAD